MKNVIYIFYIGGNIMSSYKRRPSPGNTEWFVHDRFGMFIHFGLYAAPARHEWIQSREEIQPEDYQKYFDHDQQQ